MCSSFLFLSLDVPHGDLHPVHIVVAMGTHVPVQVPGLGETGLAYLALVRLLPGVGAVVLGEGGAVGEPLVTHVALVGTVPGVGPHVCRHGRGLREPSVADGALEGFLPGVGPEVGGEVCRLSERLLAYGALVRLLPAVGLEVGPQGGETSVSLSANVTRIDLTLSTSCYTRCPSSPSCGSSSCYPVKWKIGPGGVAPTW